MPFERELSAMHRWADEADRIAMEHFRIGVPHELKADRSPVTAADTAIETLVRRAIEREFGDAVLGEEEGGVDEAARRWLVDPIDGTKNYRRGIPIFATLIALEQDGVVVAGLASAPALRARWWATRGGGAYRDGEQVRVSEVRDLAQAEIATNSLGFIRKRGLLEPFLALEERLERQRGFGDFWGHMLVAQGSVEIMLEPEIAPWDIAAPKVIVEEAGGRLTSLSGEDTITGGDCLTTNGHLHEQVLQVLTRDT